MKTPKSSSGSSPLRIVRRLQAMIQSGKNSQRLSANVTGEEDWEVDEPQIRMSRAFAVMLVLHLVAVGGLFAFHMFGKDDRDSEGTATRMAHESSPPPPVATSIAATPKTESQAEPGPHVFKAGETKMLVAAKFGVTVRELEDANPGSEFSPGDSLNIPHHPRLVGALAENSAPANPPLAIIAATPSEDVGHLEFALKKGGEDPYAPVSAAELPAEPTAKAKLVKAEPEENTSEDTEEDTTVAKVRKPQAPVAPPAPAKPKPTTGSRTHVIQKGDTVYNVAKRYGLSPGEVMRANGLSDPSRIQMGQVLKITVKR